MQKSKVAVRALSVIAIAYGGFALWNPRPVQADNMQCCATADDCGGADGWICCQNLQVCNNPPGACYIIGSSCPEGDS